MKSTPKSTGSKQGVTKPVANASAQRIDASKKPDSPKKGTGTKKSDANPKAEPTKKKELGKKGVEGKAASVGKKVDAGKGASPGKKNEPAKKGNAAKTTSANVTKAPSKLAATTSKVAASSKAQATTKVQATTKAQAVTKSQTATKTAPPAKANPASPAKGEWRMVSGSKAKEAKPATQKAADGKAANNKAANVKAADLKSKPAKTESPSKGSPPPKSQPAAKLGSKNEQLAKPEAKPVKIKGPVSPPPSPTSPKVIKKIRELQTNRELRKDLAQDIVVRSVSSHGASDINHDPERDRMVLVVRDSFWLHVSWEVTRRSVERAKAAMAEQWHTVHPILRVVKVDNSSTTNNSETIHRDIEIHGGVRNWYIDVSDPPATFRVLLGYMSGSGRFHELIRSNIVTTPIPGSDESISTHWADIAKDAERIFALSGGYSDDRETRDLQDMFEEHLKRPMGAPALAQFGSGAEGGARRHRNFHFELEAEMIVFGSTHPDAYVTLGGEPVKVQSDGTFSVRVPLPDRRQVLPACACTRDGVDEQTIVIAVERNTKIMEPLSKENEESSQ